MTTNILNQMLHNTNRKYWILIVIGSISFLALIIFLIQITLVGSSLTSMGFSWRSFLRSILFSCPFLGGVIYVDYKIVQFVNNSIWMSSHLLSRVVLELILIIVLALIFIIIGKLPFYDIFNLCLFFNGLFYDGSVIAAILLNIFIVVVVEFFTQYRKSLILQEENGKMQYRQLKSQINPHFLFNSLSSLTSLINRDAERATDYTKKLSDVYRYVLTHDTEDMIVVEDEMTFIRTYMEILQIRFGEGLQMSYDIRPADLRKQVPPMALQVLVENAVKHNALSPSNHLHIGIASDGKFIVVTNNIIPRLRVEKSTGIGLDNLQAKYQIIASENIWIEKSEEEFTVKLPLL